MPQSHVLPLLFPIFMSVGVGSGLASAIFFVTFSGLFQVLMVGALDSALAYGYSLRQMKGALPSGTLSTGWRRGRGKRTMSIVLSVVAAGDIQKQLPE